jgi:hypothetical protein
LLGKKERDILKSRELELNMLEAKLLALQRQRSELGQRGQEGTYADDKEKIEKSLQEIRERIEGVKADMRTLQD